MSFHPKLKRIILPPSIPPSSHLGFSNKVNPIDVASTLLAAQTDLSTATSKAATTEQAHAVVPTPPLQRHVTIHPSKPLVAYILNPIDISIGTNINKIIVVQNIVSKEIIISISWIDLASTLYGETDIKKLPSAARSLGVIHSLQFYDPSILYWSRFMTNKQQSITNTNANNIGYHERFQGLAIQTDKRVILLNLRKGPTGTKVLHQSIQRQHINPLVLIKKSPYNVILAHFNEKTIGAIPSSNILPLTDRWILIGCSDGSMKCYDWTTNTTVKKIKGLGKGDWIVQLLAANRYQYSDPSSNSSTSSHHSHSSSGGGLRRILTVTKKGIVYLIELEIDTEKNTMDIQPPLARFYIGSPVEVPAVDAMPVVDGTNTKDGASSVTNSNQSVSEQQQQQQQQSSGGPIMEHSIISYDPHMDRLLWLTPLKTLKQQQTTTQNNYQTLSVWNLRALQQDFLQQANLTSPSGSSSKNLFKPDPTLVIQFPYVATSFSSTATTASASTASVISVHPLFNGDTVICITVSHTGDVVLHGAIALAANTTQTVFATPIMGFSLTNLLVQTVPALEEGNELFESHSTSIVRVHSVSSQSLPPSGCSEVSIATNMGLFVLELPTLLCRQGTHHCHFGAGIGSLGKSILMVNRSLIEYATVDALTGNPVGILEAKNTITVYESPSATHMPSEFYKRPFRTIPTFLTSPSGLFVCLLWTAEFRYEIIHIPTAFQRLGQRLGPGNEAGTTSLRNPIVASGSSAVLDFAWVGDEDTFSVLYAEDLMETAIVNIPKMNTDGVSYSLINNNVRQASSVNLSASVTMGAVNAATMSAVAKGATAANKTVGAATQGVRVGAKAVTNTVKKSFTMLSIVSRLKRASSEEAGASITADDDDDESDVVSTQMNIPSAADIAALEQNMKNLPKITEVRRRYVELKRLEVVEAVNSAESNTIPAAKATTLGELQIRGGKHNLPTSLFGGPVLCVACRTTGNKEGNAYFYTRKKDAKDNKATSFVSSGPAIPFPDFVTWDDDGRLCAIVIENRVAVYLSNEPDFILLGSVRICSPTMTVSKVTNAKFVHGTLYCCTWNSVHCVLLGDIDEGLCMLDAFLLASTDVPMIPQKVVQDEKHMVFAPVPVALPLVHPTILGYQSGSLLLSTLRGIQAVPLSSPLLRIGLLLAGGQVERATKWFDAVSNADHEYLANFLERRGRPELAIQLPGLSLETMVDISMRFGYLDRLEEIVETFGASGLRLIDMGRGVSPSIFGPESTTHSIVVCIGAYLLAHGRVELTRRLATECLRLGEEGRKDALFLGALLLPVDEADANRLITRAVEEGPIADDWVVGKFVRDYVLASNPRRS